MNFLKFSNSNTVKWTLWCVAALFVVLTLATNSLLATQGNNQLALAAKQTHAGHYLAPEENSLEQTSQQQNNMECSFAGESENTDAYNLESKSTDTVKQQREAQIQKLMSTANALLGTPYVWLGVYPEDNGMDCASFTWYCYKQIGIDIGFETYDQMHVGTEVESLADAKPGDIILMYYGIAPNFDPNLAEHVALYAGGGMIYEEPQAGGVCQYVSFWSKHTTQIQIRRIIAE